MEKQSEEPLFGKTGTGSEDMSRFYDTIETSSPEFDNTVNSHATNLENHETMDPEKRAAEEAQWMEDLTRLEKEINTLRTVLSAKVYEASELKRKLGYTPMNDFKQDLRQGFHNIKESDAYQKTNTAFKSFGAFASKKFGDMRNSNTFKSFEEKVGGAYTNVKGKVSGSKSENSFVDAMEQQSDNSSTENVSQSPALTPDAPEKAPR